MKCYQFYTERTRTNWMYMYWHTKMFSFVSYKGMCTVQPSQCMFNVDKLYQNRICTFITGVYALIMFICKLMTLLLATEVVARNLYAWCLDQKHNDHLNLYKLQEWITCNVCYVAYSRKLNCLWKPVKKKTIIRTPRSNS